MITLLTAFALYEFDANGIWWIAFGVVAIVNGWLTAVEATQ